MGFQADIVLNIPALPDDNVWFANSQAWSNYCSNVAGTVDIDSATVSAYNEVPFDSNLVPAYINIDGTDYILLTQQMFNSYKARMESLLSSYETFRNELFLAGFTSQP